MPRSVFIAGILLLATAPARAECRDTPENRQACMGDAFKVCTSSLMSGIPAIIACLQRNRASLSPDCATAVAICSRSKPRLLSAPGR